MSLPNEWGQAPFVPQGHSSEGGPGPPGEGYPPLMGDGGTRAARLPQHMVPFLKAEGGGGQRLGPATAGLSVKGLPMTENFLSQSSYRRQERQRQDGEGAGSLRGWGRAAVSQIGLGQDHKGSP